MGAASSWRVRAALLPAGALVGIEALSWTEPPGEPQRKGKAKPPFVQTQTFLSAGSDSWLFLRQQLRWFQGYFSRVEAKPIL